MRRRILITLVVLQSLHAQDAPVFKPTGQQMPAPLRPAPGGPQWRIERDEWQLVQEADYEAWLAAAEKWRREWRQQVKYNGTEYERPALKWTQRNFLQPQSMVEDRYLYHPVTRKYTVDRFLDDLEQRYGGVDSVLLWPVYPNIGIDNRNLFDLHRDMPGGVPALREMVAQFHKRNVKVFFPAMPWDKGTRDEGATMAEAMARLLKDINADGINGDTMVGVPEEYRKASDAVGHPLALEPEVAASRDEWLMWNHQSWGYWSYPFTPLVSKQKWLEPRHMVNVCRRWARDHTDDLQFAFFNGVGFETWESIWGVWNGITPRDGEAIRRLGKIERTFAELLVSQQWQPYVRTSQFGVFSSRFPRSGVALYTVVNRNEYSLTGEQLRVPQAPGRRYFDVWHGVELKPRVAGEWAALSFDLEAQGYGAVLVLDAGATWPGLDAMLAQMRRWAVRPLASYSREWKFLPQKMVEIARTKLAAAAPLGMVKIPAADFDFLVNGVEIEGYNWIGLDVQYPWEDSPRRMHRKMVSIAPFYIDKYPVTNAEFKKFVDAAHYRPADDHNFLKDWKNGTYPAGWDNKPVTWVSLEDARAYAAWAGKRLPHSWEWQYAAQGNDGRLYPWGNAWDAAAVPAQHRGRDLPGPSDVNAHPRGASPFGVEDLVGNVWQWTDEFMDEHTRGAVLRGGSYYTPRGSEWYFPNVQRLDRHGKYLLMAPSKDRAGTLGFRCVMDAR